MLHTIKRKRKGVGGGGNIQENDDVDQEISPIASNINMMIMNSSSFN
jgi:hypothetical protein